MGLGRVIGKIAFPLAIFAFGGLVLLERRRPLRRRVETESAHDVRNLLIAGTAGAAVLLLENPIAKRASALVERKNLGLLKALRLPKWLETFAAVLLLDYTLYLWHVLTHRMPILWRFHVVHHTDLDLATTTAVRFHFGEIIISIGWRVAQIGVIGVSPEALKIWQALILPSVMFHHSNLELPEKFENVLGKFIVTPRLHGIHHSVIRSETDSNWSSGLSIWDRMHGTFRDVSEHREIRIGVPAYQSESDLTVKNLVKLPFSEQRDDWRFSASVDEEE